MESRHNIGTNPWNEVAVPMVWSSTYHQSAGQGTCHRAPEAGQTAHCGACGLPRRVEERPCRHGWRRSSVDV